MTEKIADILQTNRQIKHRIRILTNEFQNYQSDFLKDIQTIPDMNLDEQYDVKHVSCDLNSFPSSSDQIQLAVCGPNNTGKTSFLHSFVKIGAILPVSTGAVTARIVKLTYSSGEKACLNVYPSIIDQEKRIVHLNLSSFFSEASSPNWVGIQEEIKSYLERPTNVSEEEFTNWARCFVEIQIPSPILELGIDVYDTPGFLFYDKQVTKENLYELVKSVQPMLIFMYQNPSVADDTKECFLALKSTLPDLDYSSIFFLNTQQDVPTIFDGAGVSAQKHLRTEKKFFEILPAEREKRLKLLLKASFMADYVHQYDGTENFDIISLPKPRSFLRECANAMTESSIIHLIQYAVQMDLERPYTLVNRILNSIDRFFRFFLSTSHRDLNQWKKICQDAREWGKRFFNEFDKAMDTRIDVVYANIHRYFEQSSANIRDRAAQKNRSNDPLEAKLSRITKNNIQQFIEVAVQEEVIKVAVNEIINQTKESLRLSITHEISIHSDNNELLLAAQQQVLTDISASELEHRTWLENIFRSLSMMPKIVPRFFRAIRTRYDVDYWNRAKIDEFETKEEYDEYLEILDSFEDLVNPDKRKEFAESYLFKMKKKIQKREDLFKRNLRDWIKNRRNIFFDNIRDNNGLAIKNLSSRKLAYEKTKSYIGQFARIQCHLLALKHLKTFRQQIPIVDTSISFDQEDYFVVHPVQWGDEKNLMVKKFKQPSSIESNQQYLEAHYHRKITELNIPHVVPLLYLYINPKVRDDLWIFLPRYRQTLADYLQANIQTIKRDEVIQIAFNMSKVICKLHSYEIVHRDLKSKNILMDENNQCYLTDFGTCKQTTLNNTIVGTSQLPPELLISRYDAKFVYDGMAVDVYALGILFYELLPKLQYRCPKSHKNEINLKDLFKDIAQFDIDNRDYETLIESCLEKKIEQRPKAVEVVKKLEEIKRKMELKFCMLCETKERYCRYYPCGHKILCLSCHNDLRKNHLNQIQCILCQKVIKTIQEDDVDQTLYLKSSAH